MVRWQDYDDDGETAAGGRLLHLLQVVDARNVVSTCSISCLLILLVVRVTEAGWWALDDLSPQAPCIM